MASLTTQPGERVLSTLNADGSRRWICPRPSRGKLWRARRATAYALIAVFTVLPHLRIGGKPAVLLDVANRRFTILGTTFLPTDTLLLALLAISVLVTIFLLTALFGRVWCGWGCPQTVYMEFVYRPIERLFDGEPGGRKPKWSPGLRAFLKYACFVLVSLVLAHTFLAYFVGTERLAEWVRRSPLEHPSSFLIMAGVTGAMLFDFGLFREQTCIVACPYGRFQSVLLDRDSLIVGYDARRGEPRGKKKRGAKAARDGEGGARSLGSGVVPLSVLGALEPVKGACSGRCEECGCTAESAPKPAAEPPPGDCIDCRMCVTTCPTGIDIRDGLQLECIHCAQCIDACDAVMDKIGRPRGLIRYGSQAGLAGRPARRLRPRVVLYPALLVALVSVLVVLLLTRATAEVAVMRQAGLPFNELPEGGVSNQLRVRITNLGDSARAYTIELVGVEGGRVVAEENPLRVEPGQTRSELVLVRVPRDVFVDGKLDAAVRVSDGEGFVKDAGFRLLGPRGAGVSKEGGR